MLTPLQLSPLEITGIVFVLLLLIAGLGVAYVRGAFDGLLSGGVTPDTSSTEEDDEDDSTQSIAGGQPFDASEDAGKVTPSGRQPGGGTKVEVRGTRNVQPLGTLIEAEVKNGELNVSDTVRFSDQGIEGRVGTLQRDGQNIETASEGDVVSFSLIGVDQVSLDTGTVGEKETQ